MRAEFGRGPGFEERFAREIRNSDRVRSPWTPAVVDYSPAGQRPQWLATEYVAAPSLAEWVRRYGRLSEQCVLALAAELFGALAAVHGAGLAHRDVKPSNVLLGRRSPLLIDFGIARAMDDSRHTRTGGVIGSPGYLAPEQVSAGESGVPGDDQGHGHGSGDRPAGTAGNPPSNGADRRQDGGLRVGGSRAVFGLT